MSENDGNSIAAQFKELQQGIDFYFSIGFIYLFLQTT